MLLLDEVDKELERRGHAFVGYADDANVYVRSRKAGERVMRLLRKGKVYRRLRLTITETKSGVARVFGRCFLGLSVWVAPTKDHQTLCLRQGPPGLPRSRPGASRAGAAAAGLRAVIAALQAFVLGWKGSVAFGAFSDLLESAGNVGKRPSVNP
jgi:hypothetical protein